MQKYFHLNKDLFYHAIKRISLFQFLQVNLNWNTRNRTDMHTKSIYLKLKELKIL